MKKVLLINDYENGGGSEVVFNHTFNLLSNDLEIQKFIGSHSHTTPKSPFSYIFSFKFKNLLKDKLNTFKPDIIHLQNYYHLLSPSILVAIRNYKKLNPSTLIVYTAHDYHLICPNSGFYYFDETGIKNFSSLPSVSSFILKKLDHRGPAHSVLKKMQWILAYKVLNLDQIFDLIFSPSTFLKELLELKFPEKRVLLLRNPIDLKREAYFENRNNIIFKLIFAGRLSQEKGLIQFLEALSELHIDYQFDIYGEGDLMALLQEFIFKNNLSEKVYLRGRKEHWEILLLYKNYNAFVLPSIWLENAPLSIVEAGTNGLAILTSDHGGCKEMAELFTERYLFNVFDKKSIKNEILNCNNASLKSNNLVDNTINFTPSNYATSLKFQYFNN